LFFIFETLGKNHVPSFTNLQSTFSGIMTVSAGTLSIQYHANITFQIK